MQRRGSRGVQMPPLEEFPEGPRRTVLENLHALYRAADRPGVRTISDGLADGDFRATMNRTLVSQVFRGDQWPTAWQLDSLVRWLTRRAIDGRDPDAEANRFLALYQHAEVVGDLTSRAPVASRASLMVLCNTKLGLGVLLQDGTVLTRASLVTEDENSQPARRGLAVRAIDSSGPWTDADILWRDPELSGLAVLAPSSRVDGAAGARWGTVPPPGSRVRIYGVHDSRRGEGLHRIAGIWLAGTTMGPTGSDGGWQLDVSVPPDSDGMSPARIGNWLAGAAVLDESGRVVGVLSHQLPQTSFYWMTPFDVITAQVPSLARRR
ncbi:serine protease [Streptomyces sp. NPDC002467]|uniref:S1 family peptidase n=1 Tax=Streptomyces sp. NPDC002467 TaxID=3364647 RepID=UPI00369525BD